MTALPAPAARVLRGLLEDGDGRPLAGARVRAEGDGAEVLSAPDGRFSLRLPVSGGAVALRVLDHGHDVRVEVAPDGDDTVRIVAIPPDAVALRIRTPGTTPVPTRFGWQALRRSGDDDGARLSVGPGGEAGTPRFVARGLAPGTYAVVVWGGPFLPTAHEPVVLDGVTSAPLVTLELLRRGASVAGRVLSPTHAPRGGVRVTLRPEDKRASLPAARTACVSDAGGRWRVEGLPAGRYAVLAEGGAEAVVNLVEREERALDVVF